MSTISLRMNEDEEKLIKEYARANNVSLFELFNSSVLEHIENDIDLKLYHQALQEHPEDLSDIPFDEMMKELELNK